MAGTKDSYRSPQACRIRGAGSSQNKNPSSLLLIVAYCIFQCQIVFADSVDNQVIVIVNKEVQEQKISLGAVRSIFGMRLRSWVNGRPVRVFVFNDSHPVHIEFSKKILGVFPHQLRSSWDRLVFSGTGQSPSYVKSEIEMLSYIKHTPGAIGYIRKNIAHEQVNELRVAND